MDIQIQGFFGLLVLIADIWAILPIIQSSSTTGKKLWILIILFLPLLGVIIWWLAGPWRSGIICSGKKLPVSAFPRANSQSTE